MTEVLRGISKMFEPGEIKGFNCAKGIAEINLELIRDHGVALAQARIGSLPNIEISLIPDDKKKLNRVRGLVLTISAQLELITSSRAVVKHNSIRKWKKEYKKDEKQKENPFEEDDNSYNNLIILSKFLKSLEQRIITADKTIDKEDDFILETTNGEETITTLTENYFEMLEALEDSYEQIYTIMLENKIVSAGVEEDEEMSYKEKEKEAMRRVTEA